MLATDAIIFCALLCLLNSPELSGFVARSALNIRHSLKGTKLHMKVDETIVVTGLGVISPSGNTVQSFYDNVFGGVSAISKVDRFNPEPFKCQIAAQIRDFDPKQYFSSKKRIKQNDLSCQYAVAASHLAIQDANLNMESIDSDRVGVIVGSAFGGMDSFEKAVNALSTQGAGAVDTYTIPMILGNTAAGVIAMETGAKGPNFAVQTACATATHALGEVSWTRLHFPCFTSHCGFMHNFNRLFV